MTNQVRCRLLVCVLSLSACDALEKAHEREVEKTMDKIHKQVADDAVEQYDIAKRGSNKMQTCVQAGLVAAAYLQAKDEPNYHKWSATEKADCEAAGLHK